MSDNNLSKGEIMSLVKELHDLTKVMLGHRADTAAEATSIFNEWLESFDHSKTPEFFAKYLLNKTYEIKK